MADEDRPSFLSPVAGLPEQPTPAEGFAPTEDGTGATPLPPRAALSTPPAVYDPTKSLTEAEPGDAQDQAQHRASPLGQYFPPRGVDDAARAAAAQVPLPHEPPEFEAYGSVTAPVDPMLAWAPVRPTPLAEHATAAVDASSTVGLSKPTRPWSGSGGPVPEPVDVDEPEVIRPIAPPPSAEIMPTTGPIPLQFPPSEEAPLPQWEEFEPQPLDQDPVRLLGEIAVAAASLAAAGAPPSTDRIPRVDSTTPLPSFGDGEPFVPRYEEEGTPTGKQPRVSFLHPATGALSESTPRAPVTISSFDSGDGDMSSDNGLSSGWRPVMEPPDDAPQTAGLPTQGPAAQGSGPPGHFVPQSQTPSATPEVPHEVIATAIMPVFTPTTVPVPGTPVPPQDFDTAEPKRRKYLWLWILIGALVLTGIGVAVYRLFFLPEPIILAAPVVTEAPPVPTIEPVAITDTSEFLAALPTEISTYVMTSYEVVEVIGDETLPARAAEHLIVTYGESTGSTTLTVNAYQFYNEDEAQIAYDAWAEGAADVVDVTGDGQVVGQRALLPEGADSTIVWRNLTSVFVLTGPADEVEHLYTYYGL